MPNWCANTLQITGSKEDVAKVIPLFINEKGDVDFDIIAPMPAALEGLITKEKVNVFALNKDISSRLGALPPEAFLNGVDAIFKKAGAVSFSKQTLETLLMSEPFFDTTTPIEQSVEMSVNEKIKAVDAAELPKKIHDYSVYYTDAVKLIMKLLSIDWEQACHDIYGTSDWYKWRLRNWGTKWNVTCSGVTDAYEQPTNPDDVVIAYYLDTAWNQPSGWFEELSSRIDGIEGVDIEMSMKYAEGGCMFGGELYRDSQGEISNTEMSEDEIIEYLNIEDDEEIEDEDYDEDEE